MKTLDEFMSELGWNTTELARQAGIDYRTAKKAVDGDAISHRAARDIASAIARATDENITVGSIRGLVIR